MVSIRRADLRDLEALVQLRVDFLREEGNVGDGEASATAEAIRSYVARKLPGGEFAAWVAEVEGRIVGTAGLVFLEKPPRGGNLSGREACVVNMYTVPEWRGRGVATAVLAEIVRFVKTTDARRIRLHATAAGRPIYEKAGFVPTTREMVLAW